ncbi:MAG: ABC transporter permease, partial [Micrococcales bacterium]|nr:ABC transporter permease [Micrococcales bacterium]
MSSQERLTDTLDSREVSEEVKGMSQGALVRKRFLGHTAAVISLIVLACVVVLAISSVGVGFHGWWKYTWTDTPPILDPVNPGHPTLEVFHWANGHLVTLFSLGEHPFGQDDIGRDYFAMTMRGTQISLLVTLLVGLISGLIGVVIGAVSGFFRGWIESVLMRFTDMVIIIPLLVLGAVVAFNSKANVF